MITQADLNDRIKYHKPGKLGVARITAARKAMLDCAETLVFLVPEGRSRHSPSRNWRRP